jgi:23S rRNA pseudouridine1911/1915/1917 synthase
MMGLFKEKKIKKSYIAFTHGHLPEKTGRIEIPIEGLPAATNYKVISARKDFDIVEVLPETGRTNQIRIHFKAIGHPLVGETKFAFRKDYKLKAKRACLHAKYLEFVHPVTGSPLKIDYQLAADMQKFLELHPN